MDEQAGDAHRQHNTSRYEPSKYQTHAATATTGTFATSNCETHAMSPVPQTPETPSADNRPVRGARSCTLCRQMKARCNATEQYPNPCSRCAHLGKAPCVIEPSF